MAPVAATLLMHMTPEVRTAGREGLFLVAVLLIARLSLWPCVYSHGLARATRTARGISWNVAVLRIVFCFVPMDLKETISLSNSIELLLSLLIISEVHSQVCKMCLLLGKNKCPSY